LSVTTPSEPVCSAEPNNPLPRLSSSAQIELQPAAHRADHVGLEIRIDEVLEVRQPVFRRHFEQQPAIGVSHSKSGVML